jgi:hypothetical protein
MQTGNRLPGRTVFRIALTSVFFALIFFARGASAPSVVSVITARPDPEGASMPPRSGFHYIGAAFIDPLQAINPHFIGLDQLYDIVMPIKRGADGSLDADFSALDASLDLIARSGAAPFLSIDYTPTALSSRPHLENSERRATPPSSYEEWDSLVYETVRYVNVERKSGVLYWSVWNEPDMGMFWSVESRLHTRHAASVRDADLWTPAREWQAAPGVFVEISRIIEYMRLYETTARAAKRADPTIRVGGPNVSSFNLRWLRGFLNFCAEQNIPVDFLSWHYPSSPQELTNAVKDLRSWTGRRGISMPPVVISEWNMDHTPQGVGWTEGLDALDMMKAFIENEVEASMYYSVGRVADAASGGLTPVGQAFEALNRVRGRRAFCEAPDGVGALAAQDAQGNMTILFWFREPPNDTTRLRIPGASLNRYTLTLYQEGALPFQRQGAIPEGVDPEIAFSMTGRGFGLMRAYADR